jgi:hypothetical protein
LGTEIWPILVGLWSVQLVWVRESLLRTWAAIDAQRCAGGINVWGAEIKPVLIDLRSVQLMWMARTLLVGVFRLWQLRALEGFIELA